MGELVIRGFHPADLYRIRLQEQQVAEHGAVAEWRSSGSALANAGPCWTGEIGGEVIGCAGFVLHWSGRATSWCLLSAGIPRPAWLAIHRHVSARIGQLRALGVRRVEAESQLGWLPGARWLEMLGFEREGIARCYGPTGADFIRWARILT